MRKGQTPNPGEFKGDCYEMTLPDGFKTTIDAEDAERVKKFRWYAACWIHRRYVRGKIDGKDIGLHRFIMKANGRNRVVDHIDGNPFNNRKSNLRICSHSENMRNQQLSAVNTSGFKGVVRWSEKKWTAQICVNKKQIRLGYFNSAEDAARRYNEMAIKYFGEFACLNKIPAPSPSRLTI